MPFKCMGGGGYVDGSECLTRFKKIYIKLNKINKIKKRFIDGKLGKQMNPVNSDTLQDSIMTLV